MPSKTMTLSRKLMLAFGLISLVTLIEGLIVWNNIRSVDLEMKRVIESLIPQTERIAVLETTIFRASLETRHAMLMRTDEKRTKTIAEILRLKAEADRISQELERNISTEEGRKRFAEITRSSGVFWSAAGEILPLIKAGQTEAAVDMLESKIIPARNAFLAAVTHQRKWQKELLGSASSSALKVGEATEWLVLVVAVATVLMGLLIAVLISRHLMRSLGGEPDAAVAAVRAVAQVDLTSPVMLKPGDNSSLMAALEDMRRQLTNLVSQVRHGIEEVAQASGDIANGNANLSQRTEQQAQGLKNSASSMQVMMDSVRANAESARQANQMVVGASNSAQAGGEVVSRVVATMSEIQSSSQRIGDIVSTIDGIAFQTNILALNAAVEAARAGESGRGFAVVAAEVRALAQRSASAAREIKHLIGASVERVDAGVQFVNEAGERMEEIVQRVGKVRDLISEISAAGDEQARGIEQVGAAVLQIDRMTQQNAAMVDQSAGAAESLKHQAGALSDAVSVFRLARDGS